jgi:hypothetical protein
MTKQDIENIENMPLYPRGKFHRSVKWFFDKIYYTPLFSGLLIGFTFWQLFKEYGIASYLLINVITVPLFFLVYKYAKQ